MTTRSRAERDAVTVEIGYALVSALFAAIVTFGAIAGPALAFELPSAATAVLQCAGAVAGVLVFVARVVHVLWRFGTQPVRDPK